MELKNIPVTYWLVGIMVAVFIIQIIASATLAPIPVQVGRSVFGINPVDWEFALWPARVIQGDAVWGAVTSIFLHGNFMHIFFNCWALLMFGVYLERRIGWKNFLKVFFVTGIIGSLAHIVFTLTVGSFGLYALGASGAIFGMLGALAVLEPEIKVIMFPVFIPMKLWQSVIMSVAIMSVIFAAGGMLGIAHDVHVAGLAAGFAMGFMFKRKMKKDPDFTWKAVYQPVRVTARKDPYEWIDDYR